MHINTKNYYILLIY